jgi:ribosomal protein L14E/L6E/L27E
MKTRAILSVLVAFLLSAPAMAEVYQYVDANGKTVFSDQPPPGARAKPLNVRASAAASAPAKASKTTALSEVEKKNAEIDAENAKIKEQNKKTAQENCKNARNNLAALQQGGRVKMPGSNALATDSQRSELLQAAQQNVASWCNK